MSNDSQTISCRLPPAELPMEPIVVLEEITKDFGSFRALDRVSLRIEPGITGLLGPNGAGKSTLIKVLLGLLRPTSGRGLVLGCELGRQVRDIRAQVGYMPEDDCFWYGMTGIESVQFAAQLSQMLDLEALRRGHEILDFCGMGQERYRKVETYSTGMRQKLRFAQAIVHDPPLLILDEPTSGLDPEERDALLNRIVTLVRDHQKTVVLCTHILPDVQTVSDAVAILAKGQLRVAGRLEELERSPLPAVHVRVHGDADHYSERLRHHGFSVEAKNSTLTVSGASTDELTRGIWRTARDCHVGLRSIRPSSNSMEEIFLSAVREEQDADS